MRLTDDTVIFENGDKVVNVNTDEIGFVVDDVEYDYVPAVLEKVTVRVELEDSGEVVYWTAWDTLLENPDLLKEESNL